MKIEEMTDFDPKRLASRKKTQSNRRLTRLFDAEDDRLWVKIRRFRFFKQGLVLELVFLKSVLGFWSRYCH